MVTAVLLNYKRPDSLRSVIQHLQTKHFIDEILVHDNSGDENILCYGRYLMASLAKNNTIYTQDDDCIVNNVSQIYNEYDGSRLVNGLKSERIKDYSGRTSLVGWGAFFDKSWIDSLKLYTDKFGEDDLFYRECDRIFTGLIPVERLTIVSDITDFITANDDTALYRNQNHEYFKKLAEERVDEIINSTT